MIEIKHVSHYYQQHKALDNISCRLPHKQCVALLGENGAGKSTLMKLLVGNLLSSEGQIYIDGTLMYPESAVRSLIGYLPEHISLYNSMIVSDYLL